MNLYRQERMERRAWQLSALTTTLLVIALLTLSLSSCKRKATPPATSPVLLDSTRQQLEQQATGSHNQVIISQGQAQQTRTPYEKADSTYASIPLSLP